MSEVTFSLEDMFLLVFCSIDDLYQEIVPDSVRFRSQHERIEFSDSEVLTLSVMQEALSNDSERSFHRVVERNYLHLFPKLLCRDRYHRRRKALWAVQALLLRRLSEQLAQNARWLVVDSAPVETVKFARSQSGKRSIPEAEYGYIPSEKRVFFGLRLHGLITDQGAVAGFALTPANASERSVAEGLLAEHTGMRLSRQWIQRRAFQRGDCSRRPLCLSQSEAEPKAGLQGRSQPPALAAIETRSH